MIAGKMHSQSPILETKWALSNPVILTYLCTFAGSLQAAYSLNWGAQEIWGKGGGETLALL